MNSSYEVISSCQLLATMFPRLVTALTASWNLIRCSISRTTLCLNTSRCHSLKAFSRVETRRWVWRHSSRVPAYWVQSRARLLHHQTWHWQGIRARGPSKTQNHEDDRVLQDEAVPDEWIYIADRSWERLDCIIRVSSIGSPITLNQSMARVNSSFDSHWFWRWRP